MAPKRPSPLEAPPNASSSEEEEEASSEEEEEAASGSGSGSEDEEEASPAADKKPLSKKSNTTAANSSGSDSDSGSDSEAEPEGNRRSGASNPNVKPIASKPMEETPKEKKPRSKPAASTAKSSAKRPSESEVKNSKRAKKKAPEEDVVADDGAAAPAEEDSKKSGDEKKLFQRLFSEDDEIVILKGMLDYTAKKGADPSADMNAFLDFIKKSLHTDFTKNQLSDKIRRLRKKYLNNARKGNNPTKPHEHKGFELSKKIWGVEGTSKEVEQPKSNGRARTPQKTNEKTLASLKAELISSPEAPKESEAMEIDQNQGVSGSLNEGIGLDMSLGVLGLPEYVVKQGLDLVPGTKRAELEAKWKKLHIAELELFVKRSQLISDQAKLILEAFKSSDH